VLLGITFSPAEDLKAWRDEVGLKADLLCDADRSVAMTYGAAESADQERPTRISVLVGPDGTVLKTYEVSDAEAHTHEALGDIG
jgi:peroxiredoxin